MSEAEERKLIVDDDWKSQAQAEKEKLAAKEAEKEQSQGGGRGQLPPADFRGLVGTLATQALLYLGGFPDPKTGQAMFDPESATHMIGLLSVLQEKTKGNLSDEEDKELSGVLDELRSRFVEITRALAQQQQQGQSGGQAPPNTSGPEGGAGGSGLITP